VGKFRAVPQINEGRGKTMKELGRSGDGTYIVEMQDNEYHAIGGLLNAFRSINTGNPGDSNIKAFRFIASIANEITGTQTPCSGFKIYSEVKVSNE